MMIELLGTILIILFILVSVGGAIYLLTWTYVEARTILLRWTDPEEFARREALKIAMQEKGNKS